MTPGHFALGVRHLLRFRLNRVRRISGVRGNSRSVAVAVNRDPVRPQLHLVVERDAAVLARAAADGVYVHDVAQEVVRTVRPVAADVAAVLLQLVTGARPEVVPARGKRRRLRDGLHAVVEHRKKTRKRQGGRGRRGVVETAPVAAVAERQRQVAARNTGKTSALRIVRPDKQRLAFGGRLVDKSPIRILQ